MDNPTLDPDEVDLAERRVLGELPPVSPFSLHGSLAPPEAEPFRSPAAPDARPGLLTRMMRTPSSIAISPLENQVTEALAWLVDHSEAFARALVRALIGADDDETLSMLERSSDLGAHTQIRLPPLDWAERQYADLSIADPGRHIQVITEVKVGAPFSASVMPDGTTLDQAERYLAAWRAGDLSGQARARRLATISTTGPPTPPPADPMRGLDLTWARDVVPLLRDFADDPVIGAWRASLRRLSPSASRRRRRPQRTRICRSCAPGRTR